MTLLRLNSLTFSPLPKVSFMTQTRKPAAMALASSPKSTPSSPKFPQYSFTIMCGFSEVPAVGTAAEIALAILLHRLENIRNVMPADHPDLYHSAQAEIERLKHKYRRNPRAATLLSHIFGSPLRPNLPQTLEDIDQNQFPDQLHALTGVEMTSPAHHVTRTTNMAIANTPPC